MSFWKELSRRNVVKVGIAYAVAAWLIIHPVDIIFPILHLPEWSITLVAAFLIICFPFVLIFSWVYEVTPKGLKKTKEVPISKSITHLTGKRLNYIIVGLLVVALGYFVFDKYYLNRHAIETKQIPAVTETAKTRKTIAVLPFEDLSPAKDQEYFVLGLSEELLNTLAQIPDLLVTGRTSSFSFKGSNKKTPEIANELGVENILEGSVRKAGNELRITAQLLRGKDGFHLWSNTYDRELKEIFKVQEDIATAVADELKVTLGIGKPLKQLGGTDNEKAYELYLIAKAQYLDANKVNRALESIDAAIALDPEFALAWAFKASIHWQRAITKPAKISAMEQDSALQAALKAIEIEPKLGQAYLSLGITKLLKGDRIKAEEAYQKGMELITELIYPSEYGLDSHYAGVGYLKRYHELEKAARQKDPLNKEVRAAYILSLGFIGDPKQAEEEYKIYKTLFSDQWSTADIYIMDVRLGSKDIISPNDIPEEPTLEPVLSTARDNLESPEKGLIELRRIYNDDNKLSAGHFVSMALFAAYFGDADFALDALEKSVQIEASGLFFIWAPVMKEARQLPRFKEYVKKIGLVDYWNKFGWPDMCHKLDNGDFVCD